MAEQELKTLGRYQIRAELGRGGFAVVYRALDPNLDREVALKVLHPTLLNDPSFTQRFRREAKALAALRHPNIITIYEVSEADGRLYIAMELADGPSLAGYIEQTGKIPWKETIKLIKPVCEALDYAHAQGVVHRDLKPANVLIDKDRGPLLTDFGLARLLSASSSSVSMTMSGGILGTPAYIAPEVWEMETAGPSADIYSLGCIVHEMLTGSVLFNGPTPMQILRAHDKGPQYPMAWPEGVPGGVAAVLDKALARQPGDRYPSGIGLWQGLDDADAEARTKDERAQQAALAAEWQSAAQEAIQSQEWSAAKMAVGRWLAMAPGDPDALAARAEIEQKLRSVESANEQSVIKESETQAAETARVEAERLAAERQAQQDAAALESAKQEANRLAVERLAQPIPAQTSQPSPESVAAPAAVLPAKLKPKMGLYIGIGGAALVLLIIVGIVLSGMGGNIPATPTPDQVVNSSLPVSGDLTPTATETDTPQPEITPTFTVTPAPILLADWNLMQSAAEGGGLAALLAAAKEEGELNIVGIQRDFCNYGELVDRFMAETGIQINLLDSSDVVQDIANSKDTKSSTAPDVLDLDQEWVNILINEGLLYPYKVEAWNTITGPKDSDGFHQAGYTITLVFEVNADVVTDLPKTFADLLNPIYKGQIALTELPPSGAFLPAYAVALAYGGSSDDILPGLEFFKLLNESGNLLPFAADIDRIALGITPITFKLSVDANTDRKNLIENNINIEIIHPTDANLGQFIYKAVSRYAPHPAAARLWQEYLYSDDAQLELLKGSCIPARLDDLASRNVVPADLLTKIQYPDLLANITFPEQDQIDTAYNTFGDQWDQVVGPARPLAFITGITINNGRYIVDYDTYGFNQGLPGTHVHFFFDTVAPNNAGVPGSGPWILYGGPSPFTQYAVSQKPVSANKMCVLVANPNHSVQPETGNCLDLPVQ